MGERILPTVLVVDDEASLRRTVRRILNRRGGCEVVEADSMKSAISILSTKQIDVMLLDITLPDGNGLELLNYVQKESLPTKVIVLTGRLTNYTNSEAKYGGAFDVLPKPVEIEELLEAVEKAFSDKDS
ncbi:MAG: response regulator, partial [Methermicoccaceae archaeon]